MLKNYIPLLVLLLFSPQVYCQNLVTNPGFELKYKCPNDRGQINYSPRYDNFHTALDWVSPTTTTPDYFHRCATNDMVKLPDLSIDGYHEPRGGDACAGICMFSGHPMNTAIDYWAEYLETRLSAPLVAGHDYYISYYICRTNHLGEHYNLIAIDKLGARITKEMIDTICNPPLFFLYGPADIQTPPGVFITDTVNWTRVSGIYHADGGEQWLTIGRFYSHTVNYQVMYSPNPVHEFDKLASNSYFLIDDVCVIDMADPVVTDTTIYTPQFPAAIGRGKDEGQYLWESGDTTQQIEIAGPGTYTRQRWSECGYYIDKFTVSPAVPDFCLWLPTAFTPNNDGKNDLFGPGNNYCEPEFSVFSFNVFNRFGQVVFHTTEPGRKWDGMLDGVPAELGVYYYLLRYRYAQNASAQKRSNVPSIISGDVTLIR
ncbi:MAG: gliding motility-associated C-terminal protein [Flavipsychrobacter sp.]|nr:gliding motility-associated C-terminal protein [Flavipsychrobacter sp.]